jgi:hypothetical protein
LVRDLRQLQHAAAHGELHDRVPHTIGRPRIPPHPCHGQAEHQRDHGRGMTSFRRIT